MVFPISFLTMLADDWQRHLSFLNDKYVTAEQSFETGKLFEGGLQNKMIIICRISQISRVKDKKLQSIYKKMCFWNI